MDTVDHHDIPLLAVLSDKDRKQVLRNAKRRTYRAGDTVVHEGDQSLNLYIVAAGHARVEREGRGQVGRMGPGDFFGELGLIEEHERTATVIADDDLTCLLLPAWEFRSLLKEHPEMAVPMLHALIARVHGVEHHPG
jgi:CRP-like cAMP-binding protein